MLKAASLLQLKNWPQSTIYSLNFKRGLLVFIRIKRTWTWVRNKPDPTPSDRCSSYLLMSLPTEAHGKSEIV